MAKQVHRCFARDHLPLYIPTILDRSCNLFGANLPAKETVLTITVEPLSESENLKFY
ncbi:MAG: hypothetical protein R3C56_41440 [Pirellulaceae bacterium]